MNRRTPKSPRRVHIATPEKCQGEARCLLPALCSRVGLAIALRVQTAEQGKREGVQDEMPGHRRGGIHRLAPVRTAAPAGHTVVGLDAFIPYYPRPSRKTNLGRLRGQPAFTLIPFDLRTTDSPPAVDRRRSRLSPGGHARPDAQLDRFRPLRELQRHRHAAAAGGRPPLPRPAPLHLRLHLVGLRPLRLRRRDAAARGRSRPMA